MKGATSTYLVIMSLQDVGVDDAGEVRTVRSRQRDQNGWNAEMTSERQLLFERLQHITYNNTKSNTTFVLFYTVRNLSA